MSPNLVKFNFCFSDSLYTSFAKLPFITDPLKLVNWLQIYGHLKGCQKKGETKKSSALFNYILKSVLASFDSFGLTTSQHSFVAFILLRKVAGIKTL